MKSPPPWAHLVVKCLCFPCLCYGIWQFWISVHVKTLPLGQLVGIKSPCIVPLYPGWRIVGQHCLWLMFLFSEAGGTQEGVWEAETRALKTCWQIARQVLWNCKTYLSLSPNYSIWTLYSSHRHNRVLYNDIICALYNDITCALYNDITCALYNDITCCIMTSLVCCIMTSLVQAVEGLSTRVGSPQTNHIISNMPTYKCWTYPVVSVPRNVAVKRFQVSLNTEGVHSKHSIGLHKWIRQVCGQLWLSIIIKLKTMNSNSKRVGTIEL